MRAKNISHRVLVTNRAVKHGEYFDVATAPKRWLDAVLEAGWVELCPEDTVDPVVHQAQEFLGKKVRDAKSRIMGLLDRDVLRAWLEMETRSTVRFAIETRLDELPGG